MGVVLNERREVLEEKFFHDADLKFKAEARRNRLLGQWAAERLGRQDEEAYGKEVVLADLSAPGDDAVIKKILDDFTQAGISLDEAGLQAKMQEFFEQAVAELQ